MSESERLAALRLYDILDTAPEPQFDRIVELAARMLDAPMAAISLLDKERLWLKASYGTDITEVPRNLALSPHATATGGAFVVLDGRREAGLLNHPLVAGPPFLRFYAAAPILSPDGHAVGAILVGDPQPRDALPADKIACLLALAKLTESELERRMLTRRLVDTADRFRDLAEVSSDWVWETDTEHRLVDLLSDNPMMIGIAPNGIGRRRWEFRDSRPLQGTWADHIAALEGRQEFRDLEYEVTTEDGVYRVFRINGRPRFDACRRFLGYRGTGSDITERRKADQRLARSEANFRYLFEKHPNPMWVFNLQDLRFVAINEAACAHYGYTLEEFLTLGVYDVRPLSEHDRVNHFFNTVDWRRRTQQSWVHRTKAGTLIDVVVDAVTIDFDGKPSRLVMIKDVTEQLRAGARLAHAESTLRQTQKLEAIGQLTGGIAHDFNNILAIMMVKMEGLADELPPDSPYLPTISSALAAGARGADLVARLMTFARRRPLEPQEIATSGLLDHLAGLIKTAVSRRVTLCVEIADDLCSCRVDRSGLETAILNLAVNARDAMPDGGDLRITARNRTVGGADGDIAPGMKAGDWIEIAVCDTGTGMPPEVQAHVFEPFFTTKGEGKGTGLGLAMVHGFVHQSGGFLTLDSVVGQGTTIAMYLPALRDDATAIPEKRDEAA